MKTKIFLKIAGLVVSSLSFYGCTSYQVNVNGYLGVPSDSSISKASTICVVENKDADNTILENEIKTKIEKLLVSAGYSIGDKESADYYILFGYGISDGKEVTGSVPIYNPGQTATVNTFGTYGSSYSTVQTPGHTTYMPYSYAVFTRYLQLKLIDAECFRKSSDIKDIWIGEVTSTGRNSDLREAINYLLIPAFKYFGQNTKKAIREEIFENDKRVRALVSK
ncbi:MAG: DUF4136 domain-containing protein [Planctomycetota bacterium]